MADQTPGGEWKSCHGVYRIEDGVGIINRRDG
jgi:hypothetical protein